MRSRIEISPYYCRSLYATRPDYRERCERQAHEMAKAFPSDPFVYARALAQYKNGLAYAGTIHQHDQVFVNAEGYNVDWGKEERSYELNGKDTFYMIPKPLNVAVP